MNRGWALLVAVSICFSFADVADRLPRRLKKAFEALEVYNYFAAKEDFSKTFDKYPAGAGYGLSVIYSRDDNPFTDIDSAFKYISQARSAYLALSEKEREDYREVGVDSIAIARQVIRVDSVAFLRALHEGTIASLDWFIETHPTPEFKKTAIRERNMMAYEQASAKNTSAAMAVFLKNYPAAVEADEARINYHKLLYKEYTAGGQIEDFRRFLERYPESPYREDAESEVYARSTKSGTASAFKAFIENNPNNRHTDDAWRNLYALEIGDHSPRSIAAFSLQYPEYPFFDELQSDFDLAATDFYSVRKDNKWGYIDAAGTVRVEPVYEWTEHFSEELALVGLGDEAVYINKRGKLLTEKRFEDGLPFRNGFAVVESEGLQGVINRLGQWHVKPMYDVVGEYSEGFFFAEQNGQYGYLDRSGNLVIPMQFDVASDFVNGRAIVKKDGASAYIDTLGRAVTPFGFDWLEPIGKNGTARMRIGEKFGLISATGDTIAPAIYDALGEPGEGFIQAADGDKYGFLNQFGDTIVPFIYSYTSDAASRSHFKNGRARVYQKIGRDVKVGVIDTTGEKVMPAIFTGVGELEGALIAIRKKDLWGYADSAVNLAIPYRYTTARPFADSTAVVSLDFKYGLIDIEGSPLIDFSYRELLRADSVYAASDSLWGFVDAQGEEIVPLVWEELEILDESVARLTDPEGRISYYDFRQRRFIWREAED